MISQGLFPSACLCLRALLKNFSKIGKQRKSKKQASLLANLQEKPGGVRAKDKKWPWGRIRQIQPETAPENQSRTME